MKKPAAALAFAAAAIFISLAVNIDLKFTAIIYLVIGTRLGATITTLIAAIGASRNAKRAALMRLMFNVFGTIIFIPNHLAAGGRHRAILRTHRPRPCLANLDFQPGPERPYRNRPVGFYPADE